ncbi:glycosyltransferase WbuB [Pueribacillus theae]|uniref:Glycosyltransferase WbuB n=1 Tax=Pueribacillus theae TaxID=2171751 RepID=A0A2U1JT65_9BACI|nr:glycosyltransferase family 4 protein [Pueribacillus theae]PWA08400.1 glycosyltransferase WbuB [Pueribacillus theae]
MKTIWIINHYAKPYEGRHYKFAEKLSKKNYRVKIICASTSYPEIKQTFSAKQTRQNQEINGILFSFIKARDYNGNGKDRLKNILEFSFRAYQHERKEKQQKPDVIYASSVHPLNWVIGYALAKKYHSKLIIETRDLWPETLIRMGRIKEKSLIAKALYTLERFMYQRADHLIFTMPGGGKYLEEHDIPYKRVSYINNGVDLEEFNAHLQNFKFHLDKKPGTFNVVYAGSMGIANALDQILEAAKIFKDKKDNTVQFHFFGDGYKKDELLQFAAENNLSNVTFYGKVEKKFIPSILSQADLNIVTSQNLSIYKYGVSLNKLFDYFAAGKPILSNIPTPFNKIEAYGCGITVEPDSPEALTKAIIEISTSSSKQYDTYCKNCLEAAKQFDFKELTAKLETVINNLG